MWLLVTIFSYRIHYYIIFPVKTRIKWALIKRLNVFPHFGRTISLTNIRNPRGKHPRNNNSKTQVIETEASSFKEGSLIYLLILNSWCQCVCVRACMCLCTAVPGVSWYQFGWPWRKYWRVHWLHFGERYRARSLYWWYTIKECNEW